MVEVKQDIGLAILSSATVFGAWSAWNSSYFTISTFVTDPVKVRAAREAMILGGATGIGIGVSLRWVYGDKANFATWSAILTTALLYGVYEARLQMSQRKIAAAAKMKQAPKKEEFPTMTTVESQLRVASDLTDIAGLLA